MKTFTDLKSFERRIKTAPAWDDYFTLGGRMFKLYEYGPGIGITTRPDYVYFVNKRTHDAVHVKYDCPSYNWEKTGRVVRSKKLQKRITSQVPAHLRYSYDENGIEREYRCKRRYAFYSVEIIPNMELWRTDTL